MSSNGLQLSGAAAATLAAVVVALGAAPAAHAQGTPPTASSMEVPSPADVAPLSAEAASAPAGGASTPLHDALPVTGVTLPTLADESPRWRFVVGLATAYGPDAVGSSDYRWKLRPLWAVRLGRVRIATSRAASLLAFATNAPPEAGASTAVFNADGWRLRAALRYDPGSNALGSADRRIALPDVRSTLRLRMTLTHDLATGLAASVNVSQDLLGRGQGATLGADVNHSHMIGPVTEWGVSAGLTAGNATYMQSHFGLTADQAVSSGWAPYTASAGMRDIHVSTGVTTALTPAWLAYVQASVTRLVGPAAGNPAVRRALGAELTVGVAWRCCGKNGW